MRLYEQDLNPILGPLIGHSSDGDSRRRKIMLQLATVIAGSRFQPVLRKEEFGFFSSKKLLNPLTEIVTHFLRIWGNSTFGADWLQLETNFITRETNTDILLSCHFAVMLICYMRTSLGLVWLRIFEEKMASG